jgi:importin-4
VLTSVPQTRATVTDTSRSLAENLKLTGPALLSYPDVLKKTVEIVTSIITRKHPCQEDMALEEEADLSDIETTEFDWLVVDSAMDVISGMAVALGPSFAELWKMFEKQVLRYASSGESLERASACGVLAETITGMGEGVTPFTGSMMQVLLKRLGDEDAQTKSNAAYAVGRLVEKSNDDATVTKAYPQILTRLDPLFSIMEGRCRDNAAGCVSRLILKHRNNVPVAEVLPALVQSGVLPLKEDYEENEPVWKMIVQLCKFCWSLYRVIDALIQPADKWEDKTVQELTPQLAPIMVSTLGEPEDQLNDETRVELQQLVDHLKSMQG